MAKYIVRYAEIALKGKNRLYFEKLLVQNIAKHLPQVPRQKILRSNTRIILEAADNPEKIIAQLRRIPGVSSVSAVNECVLDLAELKQQILSLTAPYMQKNKLHPLPFRVTVQRANKTFPMNSTDLSAWVGHELLEAYPQLKVNLNHPVLEVGVEVWSEQFLVYLDKIKGVGGLPIDTQNRVISLISGGIDSPVASWMMMKRGCHVIFLYFHSFPFIGEQTKEKVIDLVRQLTHTQVECSLLVVQFAEIQKAIRDHCPEKLRTVLYRRAMNLVANRVAEKGRAKALVTGDSLAQVASQTLENIFCVNQNAAFPVFRPLIGMDKVEIMDIARQLGTFEISIIDAPDCCTVFQPQHPATKARLEDVLHAEKGLDLETLVTQAAENLEVHLLKKS